MRWGQMQAGVQVYHEEARRNQSGQSGHGLTKNWQVYTTIMRQLLCGGRERLAALLQPALVKGLAALQ